MNQLSQFVTRVVSFTSQYGDTNWRASNLIGPPTLNNVYGDSGSAWCPSMADQNQELELAFETSVYVKRIKIYENYYGGAVTKIEALNDDHYETLWSTDSPTLVQYYNIFSPDIVPTSFQTNQLRISLTLENRGLFSEIEAVELLGVLVNIEAPVRTLDIDLMKMLKNEIHADLDIRDADLATTRAHSCIVAVRAPCFYQHLTENDFKLADLTGDHLKFLLEFIYTDELNETALRRLIEHTKRLTTADAPPDLQRLQINDPTDDRDDDDWKTLDFKSDQFKWMLVPNRFIRFAIAFKLNRLEKLLVNYLVNSFLSVQNTLYVFMDALEDQESLSLVVEACLCFIRLNIKQIIKTDEFKLLPKKALLKIIVRL